MGAHAAPDPLPVIPTIEFDLWMTFADGHPPVRKATRIESMQIEPGLIWSIDRFVPVAGSAADLHRVTFEGFEEMPEPGWWTARATLYYNAVYFGARPASFYLGHPTDFPTGIVRYPPELAGDPWSGGYTQGGAFTLTIWRVR